VTTPEPPDLDGWSVWCEICAAYKAVIRTDEREQKTGGTYYDYVCPDCDAIVFSIHRATNSPGVLLN
jgi:hypothetical protein